MADHDWPTSLPCFLVEGYSRGGGEDGVIRIPVWRRTAGLDELSRLARPVAISARRAMGSDYSEPGRDPSFDVSLRPGDGSVGAADLPCRMAELDHHPDPLALLLQQRHPSAVVPELMLALGLAPSVAVGEHGRMVALADSTPRADQRVPTCLGRFTAKLP